MKPPDLISIISKGQQIDEAYLAELFHARYFFSHGKYASSALIYSWLDQRRGISSYGANIKISAHRFCGKTNVSIGSLFDTLGIDHVYVLNLSRRTDRKLRMAYELSRNGISPNFVTAVDSESSYDADCFFSDHISNAGLVGKWDAHLQESHRHAIHKSLKKGAVAYKLSQKLIFQDALNSNFKKIAIFDDDVFFSLCAFKTVSNFFSGNVKDWKIVALGASDDLIVRNQLSADVISNMESVGYYHPNPGKTCGSFAMLYDRSVFSEILEATQYPSGTFDNTSLGAIYDKYPKDCFVLFPNVVTPFVEDSDIRRSRSQLDHSKRMFWDLSRYKLWASDINIYVVSDDHQNLPRQSNASFDDKGVYIKYLSNKEAAHIQTPIDHFFRMSRDEFIIDGSVYTALCNSLSKVNSPDQYFSFFVYIS